MLLELALWWLAQWERQMLVRCHSAGRLRTEGLGVHIIHQHVEGLIPRWVQVVVHCAGAHHPPLPHRQLHPHQGSVHEQPTQDKAVLSLTCSQAENVWDGHEACHKEDTPRSKGPTCPGSRCLGVHLPYTPAHRSFRVRDSMAVSSMVLHVCAHIRQLGSPMAAGL